MKGRGDLLAYLKLLKKHRYLCGSIVLTFFLISVIISIVLTPVFVASVIIMPPKQDTGVSLSRDLAALDFGSLSKGKLGGSSSDLWVGVLKSQPLNDAIISRFRIKEVYKQPTIEDARDFLSVKVKIDKSRRDELITVAVEDKSPQLAAAMANAYVEELDIINKRSLMTSGRRMRVFVENRLKEAKEQLALMEEAIRSFQNISGAVKIDDQSRTIIEAVGDVKKNLMTREVELQTLLSYATHENPKVEMLKAEIKGFNDRLRELEKGTIGSGKFFIPTDKMSDIAVEYTKLLRDAKIQEHLVELLIQQYETAKIQEIKDTPTVEVLEWATAPERKSKPNKRKIVLKFTLLGILSALVLPLALEYAMNFRKQP